MKVFVTGAVSQLATALIPMLLREGHQLVLTDLEPPGRDSAAAAQPFFQADIRDAGALTFAMQGCDAVIHTMAFHGNMMSRRNNDDYHAVNVTGMHNVLTAMKRHGIKRLVFSSSEVVYGDGMKGRLIMDEDTPTIPTFIYAHTKVLNEAMCEYYSRVEGFRIAMLRYGCFVPADWKVAGMGRLNNWLDREDSAQANLLALRALAEDKFTFEAFLIHCKKPFRPEDWPQLANDPQPVVERYFSGSTELLRRHGLTIPNLPTLFDIGKAERVLGYRPRHNFEQFLERLRLETGILE